VQPQRWYHWLLFRRHSHWCAPPLPAGVRVPQSPRTERAAALPSGTAVERDVLRRGTVQAAASRGGRHEWSRQQATRASDWHDRLIRLFTASRQSTERHFQCVRSSRHIDCRVRCIAHATWCDRSSCSYSKSNRSAGRFRSDPHFRCSDVRLTSRDLLACQSSVVGFSCCGFFSACYIVTRFPDGRATCHSSRSSKGNPAGAVRCTCTRAEPGEHTTSASDLDDPRTDTAIHTQRIGQYFLVGLPSFSVLSRNKSEDGCSRTGACCEGGTAT
jgi:hypothetical protein